MNVIVFALHGAPVAALGPYGNEWVGTPHLDRLAAEGIVFDQHVSDCPDPAAARRAWRTGRHQIPPLDLEAPRPPSDGPDLLTMLAAQGVQTVLVRANRPTADAPADFYAGWDELFDVRPDPADESPADALLRVLPDVLDGLANIPAWLLWVELDRLLPPWTVRQDVFEAYVEDLFSDEPDDEGDTGGEELVSEDAEAPDEDGAVEEPDAKPNEDEEEADDAADEDDEEMDLAAPVEPVAPWADPPTGWFDRDDLASWELLHRTFAAVVTVFDAELGQIFDLFRDRGLDRTAAWVVTADRGFPLGEHGLIGPYRPYLYAELVHVPLIVRLPDAAEAGRRVPGFTQPGDLPPTLARWLGADFPPGDGVDLAPLIAGTTTSVRPFACSGITDGPAAEWAIRTPEWAYLLPVRSHPDDDLRSPMLFEKPDDRCEANDVRTRHVEQADSLEQTLREAVGRASPDNGRPGRST